MFRLLCLASTLRAVALRSRRSQGPNDEEIQDYVDDFWELTKVNLSSVPLDSVKKRTPSSQGWCNRSRFAVPSQEDYVSGKKNCSENHRLHVGEFLHSHCMNDFGQMIRMCDGPGCQFYWVEIPSSGSSSMKSMLHPFFDEGLPTFGAFAEKDVEGVRAFAFLRHPVARFMSAYTKIMAHLEKVPPTRGDCLTKEFVEILKLQEPKRFETFVNLFVERGPGIVELYPCPEHPCLLFDFMSQTWFLNLWPGPVDYLGHVESMQEDIKELSDLVNVSLSMPMKKKRKGGNTLSTEATLALLGQRLSIQKLHDYFRPDMRLHGYPPLPGFK